MQRARVLVLIDYILWPCLAQPLALANPAEAIFFFFGSAFCVPHSTSFVIFPILIFPFSKIKLNSTWITGDHNRLTNIDVYLYFQSSLECHRVNTKKLTSRQRQSLHSFTSGWRETFEPVNQLYRGPKYVNKFHFFVVFAVLCFCTRN